jgi:hypothetical protein
MRSRPWRSLNLYILYLFFLYLSYNASFTHTVITGVHEKEDIWWATAPHLYLDLERSIYWFKSELIRLYLLPHIQWPCETFTAPTYRSIPVCQITEALYVANYFTGMINYVYPCVLYNIWVFKTLKSSNNWKIAKTGMNGKLDLWPFSSKRFFLKLKNLNGFKKDIFKLCFANNSK